MASNLYGNDSDGDSDNSFGNDNDDDDDGQLYGGGFQPVTEDMLTLVVTRGLDDIYTGDDREICFFFPKKRNSIRMYVYITQTYLMYGLVNDLTFLHLKAGPQKPDGHVTSVNLTCVLLRIVSLHSISILQAFHT